MAGLLPLSDRSTLLGRVASLLLQGSRDLGYTAYTFHSIIHSGGRLEVENKLGVARSASRRFSHRSEWQSRAGNRERGIFSKDVDRDEMK